MKENELVKRESESPVSFNFFDKGQFEVMQRVCKMFASSELVPDMYKTTSNNPENKAMANCMIAIEMAQRIGASPLMIMQNMVIIYGRPSWSSKFKIATVNTCGRFEPLKFRISSVGFVGKVNYSEYEWSEKFKKKVPVSKEFDGTKLENLQCVAYTTAKGSNEALESAPIDIKMAICEGWYTKSGSKWQTMTRQMLMYRTASFWTDAYAPELSMGMKTEDEYRDIIDIPYEEASTVMKKVEAEKAENANKQILSFEEAQEQNEPEKKEEKKTVAENDKPGF